jgi:hypothetical protein
MTDTEINVAIANLCGTMPIPSGGIVHLELDIPNYCGSLDAMHEAEQAAWDRDWNLRFYFVDHLARVINPVHGYRMLSGEDLLDATAKQRAEAFLRVHGKWID